MFDANHPRCQRCPNAVDPTPVVEDNTPDPLLDEAAEYVRTAEFPSVANLQRKFLIGYRRASRIRDQLVAAGIVTICENGVWKVNEAID